MKKIILFLFISLLTMYCFLGKRSSTENNSSDEVIKVMEPVYLDYVQEIHLNQDEYMGKTIEIEGMFTSKYDEIENKTFYYIYRLSDNIHYHDDKKEIEEVMSGFKLTYDKVMPKEKEWIKVIGVLEKEDNDIVIKATSITTMQERGLEKVTSFY